MLLRPAIANVPYRAAASRYSTPFLSIRCMSYADKPEVLLFFLQPTSTVLALTSLADACGHMQIQGPTSASLYGLQDQEFGPHKIHASEIFARTALSFAFANLKPVVPGMISWDPLFSGAALMTRLCDSFLSSTATCLAQRLYFSVSGHVLVCSRRVVQRFTSLRSEETSDLWWVSVCMPKCAAKACHNPSFTCRESQPAT